MDGGAAKGHLPSGVARVVLLACATLMTVGCYRGEQGLVLGGYGDFVCLDGIAYESVRLRAGGDIAGRVDRSSVYARTEVQMQGEDPPRPGGRQRDGDAGQLEPGTPLYRLAGHDPESRLAARFDGGWQVYDAKKSGEAGAVPCSRG